MSVELLVFVVAAAACLAGAIGVVASSNPVNAALSLVGTLFGIAVLFVAQEANFLAAVQVIVYAGAVVVLFLFVIMFLGVDQAEDLRIEPLGGGQRIVAGVLGAGVVGLVLASLADTSGEATGVPSGVGALSDGTDLDLLSNAIFTRYVFAFELTSALLVIAVLGAVVMVRRVRGPEIVDPGQDEREEELRERRADAEQSAEEPASARAVRRFHPDDTTEADADEAEEVRA